MISKEQAKILNAVKNNKYDKSDNFFESNKLLIKSMRRSHYLIVRLEKDGMYYRLTHEGAKELSIYNGNKQEDLKNNLIYPILTAIIGYLLGLLTPRG